MIGSRRRLRGALFAGGLFFAAFCACGVSRAESDVDRARALVKEGLDHFKMGRYVEARDEFVAAYKIYQHDSILLNLGLAHEKTGDYVDAERELMHYIADYAGATPEEIATARTTLFDVRGHLGTLRVHVMPSNAHVTIDEKPIALTAGESTELRVIAGERVVSADAKGFVTKRTHVRVDTSRVETLEIKLDPIPPSASATYHLELPSAGMVLAGVGLASTGFAIYSGIHTLDLNNQYSVDHDPGTRHEGLTFRTVTDVSAAIAIAAFGAGAYLIFRKTSEPSVGTGFRVEPTGTIRF